VLDRLKGYALWGEVEAIADRKYGWARPARGDSALLFEHVNSKN
jgi:hypothetical protein